MAAGPFNKHMVMMLQPASWYPSDLTQTAAFFPRCRHWASPDVHGSLQLGSPLHSVQGMTAPGRGLSLPAH